MNTYQIIATDEETGKEVVYPFDSAAEYWAKMKEIQAGYAVLQEHTVTRLTVQRKKDLFS